MLIDTTVYRRLTGDTTSASATVEQALADAQGLLEDVLGRRGMLELGERTETVDVFADGTSYPTATPVVSADGVTVHGDVVYGASTLFATPGRGTVTYVGGIDPDDVPGYMAADLAWCAYDLLHAQGARRQRAGLAGATQVRLGDAAVTYQSPGHGFEWSPSTLRHRRRTP